MMLNSRVPKRLSAGNPHYPKIEESSTRGEAASATGGVMSPGRCSSDVGDNHLLSALSQSAAERLDLTSPRSETSTPTSFVFNGAIIWAGRLPPICRAGYF